MSTTPERIAEIAAKMAKSYDAELETCVHFLESLAKLHTVTGMTQISGFSPRAFVDALNELQHACLRMSDDAQKMGAAIAGKKLF